MKSWFTFGYPEGNGQLVPPLSQNKQFDRLFWVPDGCLLKPLELLEPLEPLEPLEF
jgi:hypothetical protein